MIYCHGCGKNISETASNCPHCGAIQIPIPFLVNTINPPTEKHNIPHWTSIASLIFGIVIFALLVTIQKNQWNETIIIGYIRLGSIPIIFGVISLVKKIMDTGKPLLASF